MLFSSKIVTEQFIYRRSFEDVIIKIHFLKKFTH